MEIRINYYPIAAIALRTKIRFYTNNEICTFPL